MVASDAEIRWSPPVIVCAMTMRRSETMSW
jgi:hypothetical protein